jgi:hypothetical protein
VSGVEREADGEARTGAASAAERGVEAEQGQEGSSASRRSVDELFARIRASRAAEEAAVLAATGMPFAAEAEQAVELIEVTPEEREEAGLTGQVSSGAAEADQIVEAVAGEVGETAETVAVAVAVEVEIPEPLGPTPDADAITEPDVESLARRDHLLGSITAKLGRALKRALQDDQNDLLNALRQSSRKPVLDELIPPNVQRERFVTAASDQLAKAYEAGAAFLVTGDGPGSECGGCFRSRGLARRRARGRPLRNVAPKDRRVAFRARRKPGGLVGRGRGRVSRVEGDPGRRACR